MTGYVNYKGTEKNELKYVVTLHSNTGDVFCEGVFDSERLALGSVLMSIMNMNSDFQEEGDEFSITEMKNGLDDDGWGYSITINSRKKDKTFIDTFYIIAFR